MLLTTSLCMLSASVGAVLGGLLAGAKHADAQERHRHLEQSLLWFNLKYSRELASSAEQLLVQKQDLASVLRLIDGALLGEGSASQGDESARFAADG